MFRFRSFLMSATIFAVCMLLCGCLPAARFTADRTSGNAPLTVAFTDNSATMSLLQINMSALCPIRTWDWDFGDGGGSTDRHPVHVYTRPGTYSVSLTVSNLFWRATTTKQRFITVGLVSPTAAFSADQTSGTVPFTVAFTDQSTPGSYPITSWQWDFGDGGGSAEANPVHVYETDGVYSVSLTVSGPGGSHTLSKHNFITVGLAGPTARFTADKTQGPMPLTVRFSDLSIPGAAPVTAWLWDFGDGATSTVQHPVHTYNTVGSYAVSLRVTTSQGSNTLTRQSYILVQQQVFPPIADFTAAPVAGNAPLTVTFTDTSTPGTAPITQWAWEFGDGSLHSAQNPTHTYNLPGTYTVSLKVTTTIGTDTKTATDLIRVAAPS